MNISFQEFARLHKSEYKAIVAKVKAAKEEESSKEKEEESSKEKEESA